MQARSYAMDQIFSKFEPLLKQKSLFNSNWTCSSLEEYLDLLRKMPILVVGAGGLGCELVKNLALTGIRLIHLIDMDTIELTNLNRQFLFRQADIGKFKAQKVAQFVMRRCPQVTIIPHTIKVQELPLQWYSKFCVIVGGLDNVQARLHLNNIAFQLSMGDNKCFYVDGATAGFNGQTLVVEPFITNCYQCSIEGQSQQNFKANSCTIANTPRTPQHCIQYAVQVIWEYERKEQTFDTDNIQHVQWVYEKSKKRAQQFGIEGVTQMLTMGTIKQIIAAIATTNAFISGQCANEVLKILIECHPKLDNYFLYRGATSITTDTIKRVKSNVCKSCNMKENKLEPMIIRLSTHNKVIDILKVIETQYPSVKEPFIFSNNNIILNPGNIKKWRQKTQWSLLQLFKQNKFQMNQIIHLIVTDKNLTSDLMIKLTLE